MLPVVPCDCEVEGVNSVQKFICVPHLENFMPNIPSAFTCADIFGVCTSLMMTICEDSVHVNWPHQPIFVVSNTGIQSFHSLVEKFTPSNFVNDEFEDFSQLALEAFPFEPFDDITVRLLFLMLVCCCISKLTSVQHCVANSGVYMRNNCSEFGGILATNHTIKCQETRQKRSPTI